MRFLRVFVVLTLLSLLLGASAGAYTIEITKEDEEFANQQARKAVEEREREIAQVHAEERARAEALEREAAQGAEVEAQRARAEQAELEASTREAQAEAQALACRVPSLRGHSLAGARRLLHVSNCALGGVHVRRGSHGALVVVGQGLMAGVHRPSGTRVTIVLGRQRG